MRIIKLFKNHILALFAAVVLIIITCNADLMLPAYMSEIVDVGIQQGGIESPVPDTIRRDSLDDLEMFMSEEDAAVIEAAYSSPDEQGICIYQGTEADREDDGAVAQAMSLPETVALALAQGVDASHLDNAGPGQGSLSMDDVRAAFAAGMLSRDQLVEGAQAMADSMGEMGGSIVAQRAIGYVQQE